MMRTGYDAQGWTRAGAGKPLRGGSCEPASVIAHHIKVKGFPKELPFTAALVRDLLDYDRDTGTMTWRPRPLAHFKKEPDHVSWHKNFAGKPAGSINKINGYRIICIGDRNYPAHRLAWLHVYGELPLCGIDHIDGNRLNNALSNLRLADHLTNGKNSGLSTANRSGFVGVYFNKRRRRWLATITTNRKRRHIGSFLTFDAAVEARKRAMAEHGFHENHGARPSRAALKRGA